MAKLTEENKTNDNYKAIINDSFERMEELGSMIKRLSGLLESLSFVYGHLSDEAVKQIKAAIEESRRIYD